MPPGKRTLRWAFLAWPCLTCGEGYVYLCSAVPRIVYFFDGLMVAGIFNVPPGGFGFGGWLYFCLRRGNEFGHCGNQEES